MAQSVRGFRDIYGDDFDKMQIIQLIVFDIFETYGYGGIELPLLEKTEVFARSLGETSDVVNKEMYSFLDRNEDSLTLRPEGTAGLIRAFISNKMDLPQKLYYAGPMFRYERPQKGRYRQFSQIGAECLGVSSPYIDAEMIEMGYRIAHVFDVRNFTVTVNSIGTKEDRARFNSAFTDYLAKYKNDLSADSQKRLLKNPLRILDSKDEKDQDIIKGAPKIQQHLSKESQAYFDDVLHFLTLLDVPYAVDPHLVRGLDYYEHTAFEFISTDLGAQSTFLAGGRYDDLAKMLGGPDTPGIGFAMGLDRMAMLVGEGFIEPEESILIIPFDASCVSYAACIAKEMRDAGRKTELFLKYKLDKGLKYAERIRASFAILCGPDEVKNNQLTLKDLTKKGSKNLVVDRAMFINDFLKGEMT